MKIKLSAPGNERFNIKYDECESMLIVETTAAVEKVVMETIGGLFPLEVSKSTKTIGHVTNDEGREYKNVITHFIYTDDLDKIELLFEALKQSFSKSDTINLN